jgi:hypothetical protein
VSIGASLSSEMQVAMSQIRVLTPSVPEQSDALELAGRCVGAVSNHDVSAMLRWLRERGAIEGQETPVCIHDFAMSASGFSLAGVNCLASIGAVRVTTDDLTNEDMVEVVPGALDYIEDVVFEIENPQDIRSVAFPQVTTTTSKLMMVLELFRQGWAPSNDPLPPLAPGGDRRFEASMLSRSHLYLRVLLDRQAVFERRAAHILHGMVEAYYKCLLDLPTLVGFHERPNFFMLTNIDFNKILQAADCLALLPGIAAPPLVLEDDEVPPLVAIGGVDGDDDDHVMALMDVGHAAEAPEHVGVFSIMLYGKVVRFDGGSHQSGNQRGYITCRCNATHGGCYKYVFVKDFTSHRHAAAHLFAWDVAARDFETKPQHLRHPPSDSVVNRILAALPA